MYQLYKKNKLQDESLCYLLNKIDIISITNKLTEIQLQHGMYVLTALIEDGVFTKTRKKYHDDHSYKLTISPEIIDQVLEMHHINKPFLTQSNIISVSSSTEKDDILLSFVYENLTTFIRPP